MLLPIQMTQEAGRTAGLPTGVRLKRRQNETRGRPGNGSIWLRCSKRYFSRTMRSWRSNTSRHECRAHVATLRSPKDKTSILYDQYVNAPICVQPAHRLTLISRMRFRADSLAGGPSRILRSNAHGFHRGASPIKGVEQTRPADLVQIARVKRQTLDSRSIEQHPCLHCMQY